MRNREPGPSRGQQQNGQLETQAFDDDPLRDHHIEEILSTLKVAARLRKSDLGLGEEPLD